MKKKLADDQKTVGAHNEPLRTWAKRQQFRLTKIDTDRTFVDLVSHDCIIVLVICLKERTIHWWGRERKAPATITYEKKSVVES